MDTTWFRVIHTLDIVGSKGDGLGYDRWVPLVLEGTTGMDSHIPLTGFWCILSECNLYISSLNLIRSHDF